MDHMDVAEEMTEFVRSQSLTRAAVFILARANRMPKTHRSLIQ